MSQTIVEIRPAQWQMAKLVTEAMTSLKGGLSTADTPLKSALFA